MTQQRQNNTLHLDTEGGLMKHNRSSREKPELLNAYCIIVYVSPSIRSIWVYNLAGLPRPGHSIASSNPSCII